MASIEDVVDQGENVAMFGDGPSLATATLGITMGALEPTLRSTPLTWY